MCHFPRTLKEIQNIALLLLSTKFCDIGAIKINSLLIKQRSGMDSAARVPLLFITKSNKILQNVREAQLQFHKTNMPDISLYNSELL